MAIAFDNAVDGGDGSGGVSWFHTCNTGPQRALLVAALGADDTTSGISGITYAGSALTIVDGIRIGNTTGRWIELWYMVAPATGTNTVAISATGASGGCSSSYTGVFQEASPISNPNKGQNTGTSLTVSLVTPDNSKNWTVCAEGNDQGVPTQGTGAQRRMQNVGYGFFDSDHGITPAQTYLMTTNIPSSGNEGMVCAVLLPEPIADPFITGSMSRFVIGLNV